MSCCNTTVETELCIRDIGVLQITVFGQDISIVMYSGLKILYRYRVVSDCLM